MSDYRLVYSTDPELNKKCEKCKQVITECACPPAVIIPEKITAKLRIEKAQRGGKIVTVIDGLPASEAFVQKLAKELKQRFGTGGTYRVDSSGGKVEIQGDRREILRAVLANQGMAVKG